MAENKQLSVQLELASSAWEYQITRGSMHPTKSAHSHSPALAWSRSLNEPRSPVGCSKQNTFWTFPCTPAKWKVSR